MNTLRRFGKRPITAICWMLVAGALVSCSAFNTRTQVLNNEVLKDTDCFALYDIVLTLDSKARDKWHAGLVEYSMDNLESDFKAWGHLVRLNLREQVSALGLSQMIVLPDSIEARVAESNEIDDIVPVLTDVRRVSGECPGIMTVLIELSGPVPQVADCTISLRFYGVDDEDAALVVRSTPNALSPERTSRPVPRSRLSLYNGIRAALSEAGSLIRKAHKTRSRASL